MCLEMASKNSHLHLTITSIHTSVILAQSTTASFDQPSSNVVFTQDVHQIVEIFLLHGFCAREAELFQRCIGIEAFPCTDLYARIFTSQVELGDTFFHNLGANASTTASFSPFPLLEGLELLLTRLVISIEGVFYDLWLKVNVFSSLFTFKPVIVEDNSR